MLEASAYIRAYTEKPGDEPLASKWKPPRPIEAPRYQLIFDCETTTDPAQALRFGVFQVRDRDRLTSEGMFYDPLTLMRSEIDLLRAYAEEHALNFGTVEDFRQKVFLKVGFEAGASIIGFNLPFDNSRIAIGWSEARGNMRGGFSFSLSASAYDPNVRVKHLSPRAALIDFPKPASQDTPRGMRNRGLTVEHNRGTFIDVKTLAAALTSRKHSLASLSAALGVETPKQKTTGHGGPLTRSYIDYARADVQATWECFEALRQQYDTYGLAAPIERILSEASIGKATLSEMHVRPLLSCQPSHDRSDFGRIMTTYFGGRAEVGIRKQITQVILADFKSMYPTVNGLMGLWDFMTADGYTVEDTTAETQAFLDAITLDDLQQRQTWRHLATLVKLCPDEACLPLRTKYTDGKENLTIGLNHVTSDEPLWYTLADVIASKLLTGRTPQIEKAITYRPGPVQDGLRAVDLFGRPDCRIDPRKDDPFIKLIDLRDEAKKRFDPIQQQLKIVANSTCYGILVEVNRDDAPKPEPLLVLGPDGGFETMSRAIEEPGKYFHPLLATLITGAARLMLAIAERLASDRGLGWAFCDTDSMAFARHEGMSREAFQASVREIVEWFEGLNPYAKPGSILKIEDVNFDPSTGELTPLYCYAISAKRYALFNLDVGEPVIRKASAHGLGHLMAPYGEVNPSERFPPPQRPLSELGVSLWQHDVWQAIVRAALNGHPNQVAYDFHRALQKPALQRYGATSPALLRLMKHFNDGKDYRSSVKPFGFLVAPIARTGVFASEMSEEFIDPTRRGRPKKSHTPKPIAPFEKDGARAAETAFDRLTGEPINLDQLKTYADALALYHLSPEDKFENGGPWDVGPTQRRSVRVIATRLIGKEANKVGEAGEADPVASGVLEIEADAPDVTMR